jgi:hypothetical protein
MDVLTPALQLVAAVIAVGGAAKLFAPDPFVSMLRSLEVPGGRRLARVTGVIELGVGIAAIVLGGRLAAGAVTIAYLVFAVSAAAARRAGATSCGCFGAPSAPPSGVHIGLNLVSAAVAALAAVIGGVPGLSDTLSGLPLAGAPYVISLATGTWLIVAIDTAYASVVAGMRDVAGHAETFRAQTAGPSPTRRSGR